MHDLVLFSQSKNIKKNTPPAPFFIFFLMKNKIFIFTGLIDSPQIFLIYMHDNFINQI